MNTKHPPTRSTKLLLRLPPELAERLRRLASAHDRSLNGELVWALRAYVDREEARGATPMAREEQQPMSDGSGMWTDEKSLALALIEMARAMVTRNEAFLAVWRDTAWGDSDEPLTEAQAQAALDWLDGRLAEVERLRACEAAWVKVAQVLAQMGDDIPIDRDDEGQWITSEDIRPLAEQARALLASDSADESK